MTGSLGRLLVVDDNDNIRRLICSNLEPAGLEVDTATGRPRGARAGGAPAARRGEHRPEDAGPRWGQVVETLRADPTARFLPIVMVSAHAQAGDAERGYRAGVDAYITKPFEPEELVATDTPAGRP